LKFGIYETVVSKECQLAEHIDRTIKICIQTIKAYANEKVKASMGLKEKRDEPKAGKVLRL